jgi:hypothetical protein
MPDTPQSPKRKSADPPQASPPPSAARARKASRPSAPGPPAPGPPAPVPVPVSLPERLAESLASGRSSTTVFLAVLDALDAVPHVPINVSDPRGQHIRDLIMFDNLFEATTKARAEAQEAWRRTSWAQYQGDNLYALDKIDDDGNGGINIPDGCAICGAPKAECIDPGAHFGARGESPPDARCTLCNVNFHNHYNSQHALELHRVKRHAAN